LLIGTCFGGGKYGMIELDKDIQKELEAAELKVQNGREIAYDNR